MIYSFDTYYFEDYAKTSCIGISDWLTDKIDFRLNDITTEISDYESGLFYKRELPCLISILSKIDLNPEKDIILIDGFVVLDDNGKLGLGGYLFEHLQKSIPVIGVAKNNFATIKKLKRKVLRGESKKPLYITALGIDLDEVSNNILQMHGAYRMPTILKEVDTQCRYQES